MAYALDGLNGANRDAGLVVIASVRIDHKTLKTLDDGLRGAFRNASGASNAIGVDLKSHPLSVSQTPVLLQEKRL